MTAMKTRIREIRSMKGLTLHDLAKKIRPEPTTAQTIGRIETGARKTTLDWLEKIAEALDVHPAELLDYGSDDEIPVAGMVGPGGQVSPSGVETLRLTAPASNPVAIKIAHAMGDYKVGDTLICDREEAPALDKCIGKTCYVETETGERVLGRLMRGGGEDEYTVIPPGEGETIIYNARIRSAARPVMLLRFF